MGEEVGGPDERFGDPVVDVGVEEVTGSDVGDITTNWFDSFPASLPASIRDRLLAQLEEFVLNPQIAVSLEIAIALVGVVEPGQGIVSAEAADETTITYEAVLNGYDAAIDVAARSRDGPPRDPPHTSAFRPPCGRALGVVGDGSRARPGPVVTVAAVGAVTSMTG